MVLEFSPDLVTGAARILLSVLILALGYFLGNLAEKLSVGIAENLGLKRRVKFGLEREMKRFGFSADIIQMLGIIIKYFVFFSTLLVTVDYLQIQAAEGIVSGIWIFLPRLIISITVIIIGSIVIELIVDLVKFNLRDVGIDKFADETRTPKASSVVSAALKFFLYLVLTLVALSNLGVEVVLLNTLTTAFGVSAIIAVVSTVFWAVKDILPDITSGIYLRNSLMLKGGDGIAFAGKKGKLMRVGLLVTEIKHQNEVVFVPNSSILRKSFSKIG
ncbi:MAG: mechanosensitive ion channel [Candidatus Aenigmarchaeota archaeon]|nr:mechanosensitive ion channel [Candidatus Aenigmarchaeota archaeon]